MSITLYRGSYWGVDVVTLGAGDGLTGPSISLVSPVSASVVRVAFDRPMRMDYILGEDQPIILNPGTWSIKKTSDDSVLDVVRVTIASPTTVDLLVPFQDPVQYRLELIFPVEDVNGQFTSLPMSALFTGMQPDFPSVENAWTFFGMIGGMQEQYQFDITPDLVPPYLSQRDPAPDDVDVENNVQIKVDVLDPDTGINLSSVRIWVNGVLAYDGSSDSFMGIYGVPASTRTPLATGHRFNIARSTLYGSYELVTVRVYAEDNYPNILDETYYFRVLDYAAPIIDSISPTGTGQPKTVNVSFSVKDLGETGVDLNSIYVTIAGQPALANATFYPAFTGPESSITPNLYDGYDVVIDKTDFYDTYQDVDVHVEARDHKGNIAFRNWSFKIEDYLGPAVHPIDPAADEADVAIWTNIKMQVTDAMNIVNATFKVYVDRGDGSWQLAFERAGSPMFKPGYAGPGSQLVDLAPGENRSYELTIDPEEDFDYAVTIAVDVQAFDTNGNPARIV